MAQLIIEVPGTKISELEKLLAFHVVMLFR